MKYCLVVYATPAAQWRWQVALDDAATVRDALAAARSQAGAVEVPWDAEVGIFGELSDRNAVPIDGDRIELYRPLMADPKESRRVRAASGRAAPDRAGARPPTSDRKTGQ